MPQTSLDNRRDGFTLIEMVVASVVLSLGLLAFEGGAALLLRQLAESGRAHMATQLVQARLERVLGTACGASSGADSASGVVATWTAAQGSGLLQVDQTVRYPTSRGIRTITFQTVGPCW